MKYIGLDLHKRKIFATVLDENGNVLKRNTIGAGKDDIYYYLNKILKEDEIKVAMEASYNWQYTYRAVETVTDNIVLAHPLKTRIIGEAKIKTDKIDSYILAYMLKANMLPRAYVPTKIAMENKMLLRARISLVKQRTELKNRIHAIIDRNRDYYIGLDSLTDIFGKTGISILKNTKIADIDYKILSQYLTLIEDINVKISIFEKIISNRIALDSDIELLKTIPGIGTFTAFILKSEIDDINRFISKERLCSYAGLIPSTHQSGSKSYNGRITKQGNKFIRWALTEAAQVAIRYSAYFRYHYNKVKAKSGANVATVAVARRILEIAYIILKEKRSYIEKPINYIKMAAL